MDSNTISYWNLTGHKTHYPPLREDTTADVLIIGAGITGVSCAYSLAQKGVMPVLIEAGGICDGTTGNTTGKVTIQHGVIYSKLAHKYGREAAEEFAQSQTEALQHVKNTVRAESIDCQLVENTAYIFAVNDGERDLLKKEYEAAKKARISAEHINKSDFPPGGSGLLGFSDQYVFHPVRYVNGLADAAARLGARIFCGTKAIKLEDGDPITVHCENNVTIRAKHVIQATQYPVYDGPNLFYARLYPKRTYGVAVRAKRDWPDGSYISAGEPTRSLRSHIENGARILIAVGDSHDTGRGGDMAEHFEHLTRYADAVAGVEDVLAMWSAQDYDTPDELPYICRVSEHSNVYVATGYRKWGLTNGALAAIMLTDLITTGKCRYEGLYSRKRADITSSPGKAFFGAVNPVIELVKSKFEKMEDIEGLQRGEGRVIRWDGQRAGIYRDTNDDVTIVDITCTHMGTELRFNDAEKTWDCPAHGGRFNAAGKLLEGPPKDPLKLLFQGKYDDLFRGD